jgi:hypothetical protein
MATLFTKTKLYLEANSKTWQDEKVNIILRNDGSGDYIHTWSVDGLAKPTDEQIASYETAGNAAETNAGIDATRRSQYGNIGDQLDEIYKDIDAWRARIKKIKDDNPKE